MSTTNERSQNDIVVGDGVVTVIPFQFNYFPDSNISVLVTLRDETDPLNIVETELIEATDYNLFDDRIELVNPLLTDQFLLVERIVKDVQPLDYDDLRPFPEEIHERQEDRTFMSLAEIKNKFSRTILFNKFMENSIIVEDPVDGNFLQYQYDPLLNQWILSNSEVLVDLSNYYTIPQVDAIELGLQNQIDNITGSLVSSVNTRTGDVVLDASDVGLDQVDNTSDLAKPISTATQAALDDKLDIANLTAGTNISITGTGTNVDPLVVNASGGISSVDWGDIGGTLSDQSDLQAALSAKENTITAGTTAQYYRGDKTFQTLNSAAVGLGNVNNTSDLNKPISTATQAALDDKLAIADAYKDQMVSGLVIDFNAATQYASIASNVTYTFANQANGRTTILIVNNIDSVDRTVAFPSGVIARADINYTVEVGKINVYTFVISNSNIYLACVDGMS